MIVEGRFWAFRNDSDSDTGGAYVEETPKNEHTAVRRLCTVRENLLWAELNTLRGKENADCERTK